MRLALCLSAIFSVGIAAIPSLNLTLSAPSTVDDVDNLLIQTTLTNTGSSTIRLVKDPLSILDNSPTHKFVIHGPTGSPQFIGMMVSYNLDYVLNSNDNREFVTLLPSHSFKVVHNLAEMYNFTSAGAGEYNFTTSHAPLFVDESGRPTRATAVTGSVRLTLRGKLVSARNRSSPARVNLVSRSVRTSGSIRLDGFDEGEGNEIVTAAQAATAYIADAIEYLNQTGVSTDSWKYKKWFGEPSPQRYETVKGMFQDMAKDPTTSTYYNKCEFDKSSVIAVTYANRPNDIYICPSFFKYPKTGSFSQAGIIVHELTHFAKNHGGTRDHVYGEQPCEKLAREKPDTAVRNADNYRLFAESNPLNRPEECGWFCNALFKVCCP